jgi:hypothetical protein
MTLYVVRAKPKGELMADLKKELNSGKISKIRPFGEELQHGLENARMHTGWKKIIALRPLQWKEKVCLIAISKISQSSGLSPRKMGGIGSRTDQCFGSDIIYTSQFYLIELLKNIIENVNKKETNKI